MGQCEPWVLPGDWDGFFALFFSTFPDLPLIASLGPLCGFSISFVSTLILPGLALSIFVGNLFYAWQLRRLARRTGRGDVTAIPFGVNTPTVFAYIFLVMLPVYRQTHDSNLAWQVGLFACFFSEIIQTASAFCTDWLRRNTPRAALLYPLAGIALAFLCLGFILRIPGSRGGASTNRHAAHALLLPVADAIPHSRCPVVHHCGRYADSLLENLSSLPNGGR